MWGMSPIDQMVCRIEFRRASYQGMFTPPTSDRHWIEYPSYNGGSDWGSIALDPRHGVIVANYNDMPNYNRLVPRAEGGWRVVSQEVLRHVDLTPSAVPTRPRRKTQRKAK